MYFQYGRAETDCLKQRDAALGAVIDSIGHIARQVDTDLFSAVVHHIIGQQISTKAQATVWARMQAGPGAINAEHARSARRAEKLKYNI